MRLRLLVSTLAVALALGASACGGDDGLSREEYIAQADAICARAEAQLQRLGQADTVERFARLTEKAIPILRKSFNDLEALEPPDDLAAKTHVWHEANRQGLEILKELPAAVRARQRSEAEAILRRADATDRRGDRVAREIGLKKCGKRG